MPNTHSTLALAIAALCCALPAVAEEAPAPAGAPVVAAEADRLLHDMGAYLGSADQFTFSAEVTFDHVLPTGQKLQFSAVEDAGVQRPNRAYVDWQSDLGARQLWYDGASVTVVDPATPFYAVQPAPDSLDAALDMAGKELGFSPPLGDFLYSDPYAAFQGGIRYGVYLGTSEVAGRECHSLAFVGGQIDWQISDRHRPAADAVQARHHLPDQARQAAVQRGVHRLGLLAAHRRVALRPRPAARRRKDPVQARTRCRPAVTMGDLR